MLLFLSQLKLATPSHTTPHYTTLTNTASDEGEMAEVKGQSSATPTLEPKSHDQPPKSHDHSGEMSPRYVCIYINFIHTYINVCHHFYHTDI